MANITKLAVTDIAAAFFAFTRGWVAVFIEAAVYCGTTSAHGNTSSAGDICRVTNFTFIAVLVSKARWAGLTGAEVIAFVTIAKGKLTGIIGGALTRRGCSVAGLPGRAF